MSRAKSLTQHELEAEDVRNAILDLVPAEHKGKALGMLKEYAKACKSLVLRDVMSGIFSNRAYIKKKHEL